LQQKRLVFDEEDPIIQKCCTATYCYGAGIHWYQSQKEIIMFVTIEQITANQKASIELAQGLAIKSYAGFEKMVELNLAATKATLTESFGQLQAALTAKDPQQWMALQTTSLAPAAEKAVSYGHHVYNIAVEAGTDFSKAIEEKTAEGKQAVVQVMDNIMKNAPAGSESAMAALKNAMATGQNAIDSAQAAAKQALAMAETNVAKVTEQALKAAATVSQKA
jgi:phasin family protein